MFNGSECWTIHKAEIQRITAVDRWCLRRILDIRWQARRHEMKMGFFSVKKVENGGVLWKRGPFLNAGCITYSSVFFTWHFTYLGVRTCPTHSPGLRAWLAWLSEMPTSVALLTSHHFHPSLSPGRVVHWSSLCDPIQRNPSADWPNTLQVGKCGPNPTQPNTTNNRACSFVMRYFIHRTYVLFLVNQGSTYSYSLAIIINIKTVPLSHSKTNSLTCTTKVLSTVHTTGELVFIVCSNNSRAVLKAVYGFNPHRNVKKKNFWWLCDERKNHLASI